MVDIWNIVHHERQSLIDDLSELSIEQWKTASPCDGWTIHDVLAHLVDDAKTTKSSFVRSLILARFNFNRLNQKGVNRERQKSPQQTLRAFQQVSNRTSSAPVPLASRLVETIVHGEDIRRPLGLSHTYPIEAVLRALEYQLATSDSMGGSKDRAEGLKLGAADAQWTHGSGTEVQGKSLDLLLSLTGRLVSPEALTGEGAAILRGRARS